MTANTAQRVAVERFGLVCGNFSDRIEPLPHGNYVRHSDYAELEAKLAEQAAEIDRLSYMVETAQAFGDQCTDDIDELTHERDAAQRAKEAAERAREEAFAVLRELRNNTGSEQSYKIIAAANGGSNG